MQVLNVDYQGQNAAQLFCQSLRETGFAVLRNHPVPVDLIQSVYAGWEKFFASNEKNDFLFDREKQDGYFPFRSENAKGNPVADLKEFYHFYLWGRVPKELAHDTRTMYHVLNEFAVELLVWVEKFLPETVAKQLSMPLSNMIQDSPNTLLRILHYPPLQQQSDLGAERAAAHEDINLITLLPAATHPGLEVKDAHNNWHAVACDPGQICVNVGDMLQLCTQYYYRSTTHIVTNPPCQK
jgi:isopenicillin N synthase-like dioxygenase